MIILREWLGGCEFINMNTQVGRKWWVDIHQEEGYAAELLERIKNQTPNRGVSETYVNENEPQYIERYSIVGIDYVRKYSNRNNRIGIILAA